MNKQAFEKGIIKGLKKYENTAPDESLKALAKIKVILENLNQKGYHIDFELGEVIEAIELTLDKRTNGKRMYEKDRRLFSIKNLIKTTFEKMGRNGNTGDGNEMSILINKLNKYLDGVEIPNNYLAIARLKNDNL